MTKTPQSLDPQPSDARTARRSRLPLILGIGIPVVVLAVVAALVPGFVRNAQAQAAADRYQQELAAWSEAFSSEAVTPFAEFDAEPYLEAYRDYSDETRFDWGDMHVPESSRIGDACAAIRELAADGEAIAGTPIPARPDVDGGEANTDYAAAAQDWAEREEAFAATREFAEELTTSLPAVVQVCDYTLAQEASDRELVAAHDAYFDSRSMEPGERVFIGQFERGGQLRDVYLRCLAEEGCAPFDDMEARAEAGDRREAYLQAQHGSIMEIIDEHCPDALAEACALRRQADATLLEVSQDIVEAYRTEDPTAAIKAGGDTVAPRLEAASDTYWDTWTTEYDAMAAELEELTGSSGLRGAMDQLVEDAAEGIRRAATAVLG